jgi:cytochrome oxidase Cu insertion factor (SCO1/SenC/PrrC family)
MLGAGDVESGPEKGAKVPKLEAFAVTGEDKGKSLDLVKARSEKLTVYLIVGDEKFDRPMHRFFKEIDDKLGSDFEDVQGVTVFLTEDEKKMKDYLPRVQMSVNYGQLTLNVFGKKDGPQDWNVNSDAHLTVVIADKGKVVARYGYKSVNEAEAPVVLKELGKHFKKKGS